MTNTEYTLQQLPFLKEVFAVQYNDVLNHVSVTEREFPENTVHIYEPEEIKILLSDKPENIGNSEWLMAKIVLSGII